MDNNEFAYQVARLIRQRAKWNWANEFPEPARQMDSLCWTVLEMAGLTDTEKKNTLELIDKELEL